MNSRFRLLSILIGLIASFSSPSFADVELPMGSLSGCPFVHNDAYDMSSLISTLKAQIGADLNGKNKCKQSLQAIVDNLSPLQDFYLTLDPQTKQRITRSVYSNSLTALNTRRLQLEAGSNTASPEYTLLLTQISSIETSNLFNQVDLESVRQLNQQSGEAYYRTQLLGYTSNVIATLNSTLRSNPDCIGNIGGWSSTLSAVLGGFSLASGLGVNPTAQLIGSAIGVGGQLVSLLQDSKARKSYNELVKLQNQQTLACTYYSIKKASCEYQRAYRVSQETAKLREFVRNRFAASYQGEYERFFVNRGRVKFLGDVFAMIAQMGSPLTLDQTIITSYLAAKSVDFTTLGDPPPANAADDVIKSWLLRAKAYGVSFSEFSNITGGPATLPEQYNAAVADIRSKKAIIISAERLIRANLSFIDLRRRLSSEFPNFRVNLVEMKAFLLTMQNSQLVPDGDKGTINAAYTLVTKLLEFWDVAYSVNGVENPNYEEEVVSKGGAIFEELAKGSVAQLTKQSVTSLAGKGIDRMSWAFGVIRNAYLNRDTESNLPLTSRFSEYQRDRDVLSNVIANYQAFSGAGTTFRDEQFTKPLKSFEDAFRKEMLSSLEYALSNHRGIPELTGQTAAQLCAMYSPSLVAMSKSGFFGSNSASQYAAVCQSRFKTLGMNRLVSTEDFVIDYADDCTYFTYNRQLEIQNLLAQLIKP